MQKLPPTWTLVKLGDICEIKTGKKDANHAKENGKYRFYTCAYNFLLCNTKSFCGECLILPGNGANVGEVFYYDGEFEAYQRTYVLQNIDIVPKFLYYHMLLHWRKRNEDKQYGSATNYIRLNNFHEYDLSFPRYYEQKKIVEKIEELFSGLDSGIAELKIVKEQIKVYRQAVLAAAFSGKLVGEGEKPEVKSQKELLKAAEPSVEYGKGNLPDGWRWVKTSDLMEYIDNGYTPKANLMNSNNGEIPFIKVYNLTFDGRLDFSKNPTFISKTTHLKSLKRSISVPNDVLINIVGPPLGKVSVVPNTYKEWNINQAIVRFRPSKNILPKFLSFFLQNPKTVAWLESTSRATAGQFNIRVSTCREIPIPQITLNEQTQIVEEIEKRFSESDNLEKAVDEGLAKAESLRQSILKKAFEGQLL